jgi:thiamine-monophosphate kinase
VHFFVDDAPADIAWKALAVNVSDLAAKGARPFVYLMSLSFPEAPARPWMTEFAAGLRAAQEAFGCVLVGGDTDRAEGPLSIGVTVMGVVPRGGMVLRTRAQAGDRLFVTGTIGDSALGLALRSSDGAAKSWPLDAAERTALVGRYLRPAPRLALTSALRAYAGAAMDISDGLVKDAARMARASGVAIEIDSRLVPMSPAMKAIVTKALAWRSRALTSGDDYEILASVPAASAAAFAAAAHSAGCPVTEIGAVGAGAGLVVHGADGRPMTFVAAGYDHFRRQDA